jgi:hypothetical protein
MASPNPAWNIARGERVHDTNLGRRRSPFPFAFEAEKSIDTEVDCRQSQAVDGVDYGVPVPIDRGIDRREACGCPGSSLN